MTTFHELLHKLKPCFSTDNKEWQEIINEITPNQQPLISWYASSHLDFEPINIIRHQEIYDKNRHILVMSDYSKGVIPILKQAYNKLGETSIRVPFENLFRNSDCFDFNAHRRSFGEIIQIIPLTLWEEEEQNQLSEKFTNYHSSIANGVICDKEWHLVYLLIEMDNNDYAPVLFIGAENLLISKEIFAKYNIAIESFFAVRVGGKSGSWDGTHDFERGHLPRSIANLPCSLRPKYWGGDQLFSLPRSFQEQPQMTIQGFGYESCQFFRTNWR